MRIIPAIDIIEGKCVRLTRGDYNQKKIYNEDPLEEAKRFEDAGIEYLHLVDLDGAKSGGVVNYGVLERIAGKTRLNIDFGGGIKSREDLQKVFDHGARQVTAGSIAVRSPNTFRSWLEDYGSQRIILGADARDGRIALQGWTEDSSLELLPFISGYIDDGLQYVVCTDISLDGTLQGPAVSLYREILGEHPNLNLIASGGVSNMQDIRQLEAAGCEGVIIGKALYEKRITMHELEKHQRHAH